jgi:outer membrane protein TolC
MPRSTALIFCGWVTAHVVAAAGSPSMDLAQCFDRALQQNEPLKRQREEIERSQAKARAALGGAFPHLSWDWRGTRQDHSGVSDSFGGMLDKNQVESKVYLEQPLFNGLREFSAWSGFKKQQARDQWTLRQSQLALYNEVAQAYLEVVGLESALANNATTQALNVERVTELNAFYRLGKSREGEIFSAESQLAAVKAIQVHLRGQIRVARESLSFLVGQDMGSSPPSRRPLARPTPLGHVYLPRPPAGRTWKPNAKKWPAKNSGSVTKRDPTGPAPIFRAIITPNAPLFTNPSTGT